MHDDTQKFAFTRCVPDLSYYYYSAHITLRCLALPDIHTTLSTGTFKYWHSMKRNIVAGNIPATSARSELHLLLNGPFGPTILFPSGVARVKSKLMPPCVS